MLALSFLGQFALWNMRYRSKCSRKYRSMPAIFKALAPSMPSPSRAALHHALNDMLARDFCSAGIPVACRSFPHKGRNIPGTLSGANVPGNVCCLGHRSNALRNVINMTTICYKLFMIITVSKFSIYILEKVCYKLHHPLQILPYEIEQC